MKNHLNRSCFCHTTVEMFMNEPSPISKGKAAAVGWSRAEDDNSTELHLQDLEVVYLQMSLLCNIHNTPQNILCLVRFCSDI